MEILNKIIFCPIYKITGLYCPGCGISRMFLALFKGKFYQAFRYNPLVFIFLPFFIFYFIDLFIAKRKNKKSICSKIPNWFFVILIIVFLVYGIFRNLDGFEFLKPTKI